jgi:pyridoxamine-phosphate oxidase
VKTEPVKPVDAVTLSGDESLVLPEFDAPPPDPLALFREWITGAYERGVREPLAGTLATADLDGRVTSRTVLVKEIENAGIVFTSFAMGLKGHQIRENPRVAMTFYWRETLQQVCLEGSAELCNEADADRFFAERPRAAQALSAASLQGHDLADEAELASRVGAVDDEEGDIDRPEGWCGYRISPHVLEFWHGQTSRLHRRLRYERVADGPWSARRIQP